MTNEPDGSPTGKRFYTPHEVSAILGVSPTTVMERIHKGALPAVRVSERIYRIPAPALERFVSTNPAPAFTVEFRKVKRVKKLGEPVVASGRATERVIRDAHGLNEYIHGLARAVYARGFDVPARIDAELDDAGFASFTIVGSIPDRYAPEATQIILEEAWRPVPNGGRQRFEYTYDLIDRPRHRRRAYHLHDAVAMRARLGVAAHEHCEEFLDEPSCDHYVGVELADGFQGIDLLYAALLGPGRLGCDALTCLGPQ